MTNLEAKTHAQIEAAENRVFAILNELSAEDCHELAQQCCSWDNSCVDLCWNNFDDDFFNTFFAGNPLEAARATFFGNISNWADAYIRFNAYGNLESTNYIRYDEYDLRELAEAIVDIHYTVAHYQLDLPCELEELFEELEAEKGVC